MSASRLVGLGMLIVLVDLRYHGFDVVVDLVGWAMAYAGLRKLYLFDKAFRAAAGFAFVGAISSVAALILQADGGVNLFSVVATIAWAGVVIPTCTGLMRVAETGVANYARRLRSAEFVAVVMTLLVGWGIDAEGGLGVIAFLSLVLGFGTAVLFILLMLGRSRLTTVGSEAIT
jgi:hypothetical protein